MMEAILGIIGLIIAWAVFWAIVRAVIGAGARTVHAASRTVSGKGSFSDNMNIAFKGMEPLEIRFQSARLGEKKDGPEIKEIQARGLLPVVRRTHVAIVVSVFDRADGEMIPVISVLDDFQEPDSVVFQHQQELPPVDPGDGFAEWIRISAIIPELLQPPFSGTRQLVAVVRLIDFNNPPEITHGFADGDNGILWQRTLSFSHVFKEKGYREAVEHREEAQAISVKIAIAVAMSDGSLDDREGEVIADWVKRAIEPLSNGRREELRKIYNDAMRDAYAAAKEGSLALSDLTAKLNEIGETKVKYDAVELCFEVMAADGHADPEEMRMIRRIGEALNLDVRELEALRDQRIVGLGGGLSHGGNIEELLGIEADWDTKKIQAHLRSEFQKWNNRLSSLPEGDERNNAQAMLEMIAEARRKYAG